VVYYAASVDRPEKNGEFASSLELDYPILSDPQKKVARAYGVLRAGLYAARQTFYIGPSGAILDVDRDVKAASAGDDIANRLEDLGVPRC